MSDHYILRGKEVYGPVDTMEWARWYEDADRHVGLAHLGDGVRVSTVFLGLDHNFDNHGPPLIFETMIFGGPHDQNYCKRCSTWEQVEEQHQEAILAALLTNPED